MSRRWLKKGRKNVAALSNVSFAYTARKRIWATGPNWFSVMHLNYIHVWLTRWSLHDSRCDVFVCVCLVCPCVSEYVCFAQCTSNIHIFIYLYLHTSYNACQAAVIAGGSSTTTKQYRTVYVFTPECVYVDDTQKWWWDDTQTRHNKAKLCGISLFMVQHVLFAHWMCVTP